MEEQHGPKGQSGGKKNKKKNKKTDHGADEASPAKGGGQGSASSERKTSFSKTDLHQQASALVVSAGDGGRNVMQRHGPEGSSNKSGSRTYRNAKLGSGGDNKNSGAKVGTARAGESSDGDRNANARTGSGKPGDAAPKASRGGKTGSREKAKAERNLAKKGERQNSAETANSKDSTNSKGKFVGLDDQDLLRELAQHRIFTLRKKNLSFPNAKYFCRLCEYHLDRPQDCERHVDEPRHRRKKEASDTEGILENIPKPSAQQIQALDSIVTSVTEKQGLCPAELESRADVVSRLQCFVNKHQVDVKLKLYGSSLTGFGMKGSDVNIDISGAGPAPSLLIKVFTILHERGAPQFVNTQSDYNAKIPVVCLTDAKTNLQVVLAINGQQAVLTSSLLYQYSLADPRVRLLTCTLRCWAQICHLDRQDEGTLPPFALDLMVIYFLQQLSPPVLCLLPVPQTHLHGDTPKGTVPRKMEDIIDFDSLKEKAEKWESENKSSVGELWLQLLKFYCLEFDHTHFVISILQTEPLTRQAKKWHSKKLAIEDPFAVKKNVANSMANSLIFEYFQACLRKCYEYFGMPRDKHGNVSVSIEDLRALASRKTDNLLQENEETCSNASSTSQDGPLKESEASPEGKAREREGGKVGGSSDQTDSNGEPVIIRPNQTISERLKAASGKDTANRNKQVSASDGSKSFASDSDTGEGFISGSTASDGDPTNETAFTSISDSVPNLSTSELDTTEDFVSMVSTSDYYVTASEMELSASDSAFNTSACDASADSRGNEKLNEQASFTERGSEVVEGNLPDSAEALAKLDISDQGEGWVKLSDLNSADSSSSKDQDQSLSPGPEEEDELYCYSFTEDVLTGGKGPAVICGYCEQEGHIKANCPDDKLPTVIPLPALTPKHLSIVDHVIGKIIYDFSPNDNHVRDRERLVKDLENFVRQIYPDARFALFGSSCNGFGFYSSDLDICMTLLGKKVEDIDVAEVIENVANKLFQRHNLYNVIPIPTAKVPIVKFTDRNTRLDGDISLYNTLAQRNTRLLWFYSEIDYRVKVLGYAVKVFAKVCNIGDASRGSLSSYGYILMMLHYLQQCQPPIIPVLQELRPEGEWPEVMVEGCNTWFFDDLRRLPYVWPHYRKNTDSVGKLWLGFLRYYLEEFDWKGMVVSIRQKSLLTKFEKMWTGKTIAVEDPFDVSHNLGGGLSRKMNNFIYKTFVNGRVHFGTSVDYCLEEIKHYRSPSDYFFDVDLLTDGKPPNDRGCRMCGKIGHLVKDCPNRRGGGGNKRRQQQQKEKDGKQKNGQSESPDGGKKDAKRKDQAKGQDREGRGQDKDTKGQQDREAEGQTPDQAKGQEEAKGQKAKGQEKQKGQRRGPDRGGEEAKGQDRGQGPSKRDPVSRDDGEDSFSARNSAVVQRINPMTGARTSSAAISGPTTTTITMAATSQAPTTTTTSTGSNPRVPPGFGSTPDRSQPHKDPFSQHDPSQPAKFGSPGPSSGPHTSTPIRSAQSGSQPPGQQLNIQQLFSQVQQSGGSSCASLSSDPYGSRSLSPTARISAQTALTPEQQVAMLGRTQLYHSTGSPQQQKQQAPVGSSPGPESRTRPISLMSLLQPQSQAAVPAAAAPSAQSQAAGPGQQVAPPSMPLKPLFHSSSAPSRLGSPGLGEPERMGFPPQQMPVRPQFQMPGATHLQQQQQQQIRHQQQLQRQQQQYMQAMRHVGQGQSPSPSKHPQPGSHHDQPTTTSTAVRATAPNHLSQYHGSMPSQHPFTLPPGSQAQAGHPVGMQPAQLGQSAGSSQPSHSAQPMVHSQFGQQARSQQSQFGQAVGSMQSQPVGIPPQSSQPMGMPAQSSQPMGMPAQSSQPVGMPAQSSQPMGMPAQSSQPMGMPAQSNQPMGMPAQSSQPMGMPAQSNQPMGMPAQSSQPMGMPAQSNQPMGMPAQSSQPMGMPAQSNQPMGMPAQSSQPMALQPSQSGQALGAQLQLNPSMGSQRSQPAGMPSQFSQAMRVPPSQSGQRMGMQPQFSQSVGSASGPMMGSQPPQFSHPMGSPPHKAQFSQPVGSPPHQAQFSHPMGSPPHQAQFSQPMGSPPGPPVGGQSQFNQSLGSQGQSVNQAMSLYSHQQLAYMQQQQQQQQQLAASMAGTGAPTASMGPAPPGLYAQPAMPGFSLFPRSSASQHGRRDASTVSSSSADGPGQGSPHGNP